MKLVFKTLEFRHDKSYVMLSYEGGQVEKASYGGGGVDSCDTLTSVLLGATLKPCETKLVPSSVCLVLLAEDAGCGLVPLSMA